MTDAVELAERLRLSATRLARLLRQQSDTGLTPSQLSALSAVDRHGPLTLGALAEHERVAPPTVTKVVAKLEADGFLRREVDPEDRRVARLTVTPEGLVLLTEIRARKDAWLTERISDLGSEPRARLAAALDVIDHLVAGEGRDAGGSAGPSPRRRGAPESESESEDDT